MSYTQHAILFDLDGTIIDSAPGIFESLVHTYKQFGINVENENLYKYLGPPLRVSLADYLQDDQIEDGVKIYREIYDEKGMYNCALYNGIVDAIKKLHNNGFLICLATSKPKTVAEQILKRLEIDHFFYYIGGASLDGSLDTKTAVIKDVLSQPQLQNKKAIMVGDRYHDMEGAKACNLQAIGVLYGYGSQEELKPFAPIFIAKNPQSLCDYLLHNNL